MVHNIFLKICTAIILVVSIILSWGGMIYASKDPEQLRMIGILISFVGYCIFILAIIRYVKKRSS